MLHTWPLSLLKAPTCPFTLEIHFYTKGHLNMVSTREIGTFVSKDHTQWYGQGSLLNKPEKSLVKAYSEHFETSWRFVARSTREAEHRSQMNWWMSMGGGAARSEGNRTIRRSQRDSCFRSAAASNLRTNCGLCMQPTLPCSVCPGKYCEHWQKIFHWPADGGFCLFLSCILDMQRCHARGATQRRFCHEPSPTFWYFEIFRLHQVFMASRKKGFIFQLCKTERSIKTEKWMDKWNTDKNE